MPRGAALWQANNMPLNGTMARLGRAACRAGMRLVPLRTTRQALLHPPRPLVLHLHSSMSTTASTCTSPPPRLHPLHTSASYLPPRASRSSSARAPSVPTWAAHALRAAVGEPELLHARVLRAVAPLLGAAADPNARVAPRYQVDGARLRVSGWQRRTRGEAAVKELVHADSFPPAVSHTRGPS